MSCEYTGFSTLAASSGGTLRLIAKLFQTTNRFVEWETHFYERFSCPVEHLLSLR